MKQNKKIDHDSHLNLSPRQPAAFLPLGLRTRPQAAIIIIIVSLTTPSLISQPPNPPPAARSRSPTPHLLLFPSNHHRHQVPLLRRPEQLPASPRPPRLRPRQSIRRNRPRRRSQGPPVTLPQRGPKPGTGFQRRGWRDVGGLEDRAGCDEGVHQMV